MACKKRIRNPENRKYYSIQQRTGLRKRGQIKGGWHNKTKKRGDYDLDDDGWYSASKLEIFNLK